MQVSELPETYLAVRAWDAVPLADLVARLTGRQAIFVGSGGALAVAELAAELHRARTGDLSLAATPLELAGLMPVRDGAVIMFSARGRHPDARTAIAAALAGRCDPVAVVTHREAEELPAAVRRPGVEVITVPPSIAREGFLATRSVLAMAAAVVAAQSSHDDSLPATLPWLGSHPSVRPLRGRCLVLYGPGGRPAAIDLETRLAETGLSNAQLADYRNFAHGRHFGLARWLNETTIVALVAEPYRALADATLARLPAEANVLRLETKLEWPVAAIDLLVASMRTLEATAAERGLDAARPRVPEFGRKLYHLPMSRLVWATPTGPVERKLEAAALPADPAMRATYTDAFDRWLANLAQARLGGIVLDYDGTVCSTTGRFELPEDAVVAELGRLLEGGLVVGFASGRGGSLHRDLRRWVPESLWGQVELGLYNGGLGLTLSEECPPRSAPGGDLASAAERLRNSELRDVLAVEEREYQLTIEPRSGASSHVGVLSRLVAELLARPPLLNLKIAVSAHSVDVIPADSSKIATLGCVRARCDSEVLAVGDQGQLGGNDFDLLAATQFSLSVDRCSADPTRCWNLDTRGMRGVDLLVKYLRALQPGRGGWRFRRPRR
jgi:hypothetical protein